MASLFHDRIEGNRLVGPWAEAPHERLRNAGEMSLQIMGNRLSEAIRMTGGLEGGE